MTITILPYRATLEQACDWLEANTGTPWTLARLIEHEVTPYVWLDYDANYPELFGDANGGYAAPIFYEGDTARLAAGSEDVLITITKDAYKIVARLPEPGFRRQLHELRFQKKDLEKLVKLLERASQPQPEPKAAAESTAGIYKEQALAAFAPLVKMNLDTALTGGGGIFGDDGARIKASTKKAKSKIVWNPVVLALGLHDVYRVPLRGLSRAFAAHEFLNPWRDEWERSLRLLGH
ncbi:hypothetical protein [Massilia sp. Mn16-1_5]|uniref:hypothetical protein n=1 Tax=Massilia sp. Mn16-1_5 TaxID=2079199 RepID=UPI00109ED126|nr:hypothetical protein [Massilia sp. Mn16-1_5]THC45316.1 hypothetical protein C2862_05940 [Massilia sp. Mn16-1_5]